MKKMISGVSAAALFGFGALAGMAPASASAANNQPNFQHQDEYIGSFCDKNPKANRCDDWKTNHSHWSNDQYQGFYHRDHQGDSGFGDSATALLFGLAVGAAVGSTVK